MTKQILHLFGDGDQIRLPFITDIVSVSVLYVHVEFESQCSKDYLKLCCNFISIGDNSQGIICAFHQPPRMKDTFYEPQFKQRYSVVEKYSDKYVRIVTDQKNKVKKCHVQLEVERAWTRPKRSLPTIPFSSTWQSIERWKSFS